MPPAIRRKLKGTARARAGFIEEQRDMPADQRRLSRTYSESAGLLQQRMNVAVAEGLDVEQRTRGMRKPSLAEGSGTNAAAERL